MLVAAALGFQPMAYDIENRMPMKWKRVSRPQYHLCLFILIGLYTGRRKEAILSLRWPKIDLVRNKIDFRRDGTPETKKRRGLCAIPTHIGHVILWEGDAVGDIKTAFNNPVRRAYLTGVSPHTLKHTAATWLMQSGKDAFKISDFLATSVPTLLKHYGHHNPDHQNEIADAIGARPENRGFNWEQLASFGLIQSLFFNDLGSKRLAPKAEVTGSNPVGCANYTYKSDLQTWFR